ncbi:putative quinol monooxygenase [Brevundimonas sp.]|uniref:putative quinol monooxygenase n=1 Tax=Brevundimonas sp. TaxID=1871086 RepID=UPI002FC91B3F
MIIVTGTIDVAPARREAFIRDQLDRIRETRNAKGCLTCAYSPDPLEPGRVLLIERWASQEDFDAHVAVAQACCPAVPSDVVTNVVSVSVYDVAKERWLGGWDLDFPSGSALLAKQGRSPMAPSPDPDVWSAPLRRWATSALGIHSTR